ncbi:hypothetical protein SAMN05421813_1168 [Daejeonella rubra]|uniref:DUF302 domain-containing protein n=1 Tax=Daejeonella rubra TaxID=990371 RepID=A0A1G9UC38_9SPHI|nr:hypothetical protein [Daejeonella rubra]SDM57274.1 hypothetical protein SAMN05421813_1168 [Daejeonella rubra]
MKNSLLIILLFCSSIVTARVPAIKDVRIMLHNATTNEETCNKLISLLVPFNENNNPLLFGYRGGATMLMAKHAFNPFTKLSYFKKGRIMLERAIKAERNNVELRFLRYTIQTNVPGFLNYNSDKNIDRAFLSQSVSKLKDQELQKIINAYLLKHSK